MILAGPAGRDSLRRGEDTLDAVEWHPLFEFLSCTGGGGNRRSLSISYPERVLGGLTCVIPDLPLRTVSGGDPGWRDLGWRGSQSYKIVLLKALNLMYLK
jgi:hypothetical protein